LNALMKNWRMRSVTRVGDRLAEGKPAEAVVAGRSRSRRGDDDRGQMKERKEAAHREVDAVNQIALETDQEGLAVFGDGMKHDRK